ncbi:MAG: serine/threonine protein kinase, partial [Gammaproteobacteria bacterium]
MMTEDLLQNVLQPDYQLLWYRIKRVIGRGSFGITYLAHDVNLDRLVAIKEYLPGHLAIRVSGQLVRPISSDYEEDFKFGLSRFISEGRTLTRFEHPNLVRVFNAFEANNTAYMVMNYEVGESLHEFLKRNKTLSEMQIMQIILPLLDGLQKMHVQGFIHRDIKPGN